jgi:hypothetical protein
VNVPQHLLTSLSAAERHVVETTLDSVLQEVDTWRSTDAFLPADGLLATSIIVTVGFQNLSISARGLITALAMWTVGLDNILDMKSADKAELITILDNCLEASSSAKRPDQVKPYQQFLFDLQDRLRDLDVWRYFAQRWREVVERFIQASKYEVEMQSHLVSLQPSGYLNAGTTIDEYLREGAHSIALPLILLTAFCCYPDRQTLRELDQLTVLACSCGMAMRIGNDLAGFSRELEEGSANGVALLAAELEEDNPARLSPDAIDAARSMMMERLVRVREVVDQLSKPLSSVAAGDSLNVLDLGLRFHNTADFRHLSGSVGEAVNGP